MEYRLDVGMWNQVFAVPCALVDRHLKLAGKEQLQVILWLLRHPEQGSSPEQMAQALGMPVDSALDALDYWCDHSLLSISGERLSPVPQPEEAPKSKPAPAPAVPTPEEPVEEAALPERPAAEEPSPPERSLPPRKRLIKPDGEHITARLSESEGMRFLMQEAEAILGKTLSPAMSAELLTATDDYGLPPEVMVMLLHYVQDVGRTGTSYIDSVARDWSESGIFSIEAAEEKLQQLSRTRLAWSRVSSAAGILKRSPSKTEAERAVRWVNEWGYSDEILSAAYDICAENIGKFNASYMDKVLTDWHDAGAKNIVEVQTLIDLKKAAKSKKKASGQGEKSYDTDELELMSQLDLPEDL